jgi:hypothetical protein
MYLPLGQKSQLVDELPGGVNLPALHGLHTVEPTEEEKKPLLHIAQAPSFSLKPATQRQAPAESMYSLFTGQPKHLYFL